MRTALFLLFIILISCSHAPSYTNTQNSYVDNVKRERLRQVIVIDAGHGGDDFGTHTLTKPRHEEKNLTLVTAHMVNSYLKRLGYQTIMTRHDDIFIPLKNRANIANFYNANLFVSVHYNSAPNKKAHGIEVFYYNDKNNNKRKEESKKLAGFVLDNVIDLTKAKNRGVKQENFAVIRETKMPAVLIESGFLSNEEESAKIRDPAYVKRIAQGVAKGVHDYLKANQK
jgi:N-acetylmuramoyl-L-alanine amidase